MKPTAIEQLAQLVKECGLEFCYGLKQQGKFDTVDAMRRECKSWREIGAAIGWSADAVERHYEIEMRIELDALRAEAPRQPETTAPTCGLDNHQRVDTDGRCADCGAPTYECRRCGKRHGNYEEPDYGF